VGNKSLAYVRSIPTPHALWPKVNFVHLIRDERVGRWRTEMSAAERAVYERIAGKLLAELGHEIGRAVGQLGASRS
jgi:hypothetical protein